MLLQGEDLSTILFRFNQSDFAFSHFESFRMDSTDLIEDDGQITPNSILEDPLQYKGSSGSSNGGRGSSRRPEDSEASDITSSPRQMSMIQNEHLSRNSNRNLPMFCWNGGGAVI